MDNWFKFVDIWHIFVVCWHNIYIYAQFYLFDARYPIWSWSFFRKSLYNVTSYVVSQLTLPCMTSQLRRFQQAKSNRDRKKLIDPYSRWYNFQLLRVRAAKQHKFKLFCEKNISCMVTVSIFTNLEKCKKLLIDSF